MNKIFKGILGVAVLATMVSVSSCTKTCDAGFEGTDCKTEMRTKFLGDWKGTDVCTTGTYSNITITNSSASSSNLTISIKNIGGFGATEIISGTISTTNSSQLTFTNQALSGSRTISGTLTISGTSLSNSYTVTPASGPADVCAGTYTKL